MQTTPLAWFFYAYRNDTDAILEIVNKPVKDA